MKCRSGRAHDRLGLILPSGRGGKMPHSFTYDERVAAKNDGDVMYPSGIASPGDATVPAAA
jgi:hypothetical protein